MLAALLFGKASAEGAQFFQAPVAGYVSRGSMMSQAVPVPMVPLTGNQLSFPFAEPVPYVVTEVRGEDTADESFTYALSFGVCALAVAGAVVHKSSMKKQRKMRLAAPVMQLRENDGNNVMRGPAEAVLRNKPMAYVVIFNQGMPNEGVYTLSMGVGGSRTHILTFDNAEDADRFAHQLQGENFNVLGGERSVSLDAKPLMWDARRIAEFCHRSDFEVALVPAGGMIRPPESNTYDPAQFGRPNANETYEERLQRRRMMGQKERGPSAFNPIRGSDERRRAQDVLRNLNMTRNQKRGQSVWASAMRNAGHSFNDVGEEMCGIEECGLDSFPEERDSLERIVLDDLRDDGPMGP
jgi:hypothetical protein